MLKISHQKNKSILITGANGNIGSFLYNRLSEDYTVIGTRFSQSNNQKNLNQLDLSDSSAVDLFVQETELCDTLIFLVGLAHKKGKGQELDEFRRINKQTLVNLLSKLDEKNKLPEKIIFATHQTRITIHRFNNRKININNSE